MLNTSDPLLEVRNVKKYFPITKGLTLMKVTGWVKAVDGVSFTIRQGETYGLVGESGCGKTTVAKLILLIEKPTVGSIFFEGQDIQALKGQILKGYRRSVQAVFQDPYSSLSPRMRVGDIIAEPIVVNENIRGKALKERSANLLAHVGLNPANASLYPHEFSGGQRQRIAIARSLALTPKLIILDEPVSALDVSIRAQLMNLLKDIQEQFRLSYLLIAHDLSIVHHMSDRVGVMYMGKLVEEADSEELYSNPLNPYTKALLSGALPYHPDEQRERIVIAGEVGNPLTPPHGCRFSPRCDCAMSVCFEVDPPPAMASDKHTVACHLYNSDR